MAENYTVGQAYRHWSEWRIKGVLTDPTTVSLTVTEPDLTETTYTYAGGTVTKHATGQYYKDVTFDASGSWKFKWTGTGVDAASQEETIEVVA